MMEPTTSPSTGPPRSGGARQRTLIKCPLTAMSPMMTTTMRSQQKQQQETPIPNPKNTPRERKEVARQNQQPHKPTAPSRPRSCAR
ncbi:hypothetical protein BDP81DRAFT_412393 [Colletotrichum phormii]|uniref:Uncharacterized protein n=1 Tax=Colletotrichum phormii TaxID=359342 RepID=A0AAJ0A387_9PEZI|nr:uncharacterized protein BDP81DRAFT_412393 [Colletotrichum phormii]KAK1655289.1 hypothetical protein BDP81DRAFT_412393 [Colletotrichum phormii]